MLRSFLKDQYGGFALWGALLMPAFGAVAALSIDAARMYNLDQELQSAADALARSGAAELDQRSDSIERATRAIQHLVDNDQKFGLEGARKVEAQTIRFLKALPADDHDDITSDLVTTDPAEAKYVEIKVVPETIEALFPKGMIQAITSATLEASSVATSSDGVCGVAPMFVCNPYEGTGTSLYDAISDPDFQRRGIKFKSPNNQFGPGNFGFMDAGLGNGASALTDAIAVDKPDVCFSGSQGVSLRPGNISSVRHGFNTRFDIYEGSYKNKKNDPAYAPAENVVKGYIGDGCKGKPNDLLAFGMPPDKCFDTDSCPNMGGLQGDGDWDFIRYVLINHNAVELLNMGTRTYFIDYVNNITIPSTPPSRYEVYRWEIETNSIPGSQTYGLSITREEGVPTCHSSGPSEADIDRRILYAAVLNCTEIENTIGMNGNQSGLPVETFVKVFLTEPMGKGQDNIIWGEIIGPVVEGQDAVSRDSVTVKR